MRWKTFNELIRTARREKKYILKRIRLPMLCLWQPFARWLYEHTTLRIFKFGDMKTFPVRNVHKTVIKY